MGDHKRSHPDEWPNNGAARNSKESCAKATETKRRKWESGESAHPWTGRSHSEESKQKMSESASNGSRLGEKNGMFGRKHTDSAKNTMSDAKSKLILEGKFFAYGTRNKKGHYESTKNGNRHFYRSGWELAVMQFLDESSEVKNWEFESIRIPYMYDCHKRWYVPDFLVTYSDETRKLIEIKPKQFFEAERVILKSEAAQKWCVENNASYLIVDKDVLKSWGCSLA